MGFSAWVDLADDHSPVAFSRQVCSRDGQSIELQPTLLPDSSADTEAWAQFENALSRRSVRELRAQMRSLHAGAMTWSESLVEEMNVSNLWGLLRLHHTSDWQPLMEIKRGDLLPTPLDALTPSHPLGAHAHPVAPMDIRVESCLNVGGHALMAFRIVFAVGSSSRAAFELLTSISRRREWDLLYHEGHVVRQLESSMISHQVFEPLSTTADRAHDYCLLTSWRRTEEDSYEIASRSIVIDEVPELERFQRGEVLPSGWLIEQNATAEDGDCDRTFLTFIIQLKAELLGVEMSLASARRVAVVLLPSVVSLHGTLDGTSSQAVRNSAATEDIELSFEELARARRHSVKSVRERLREWLSEA